MAGSQHYSDLESDNCADWSAMEDRRRSFRDFPQQVPVDRLARAGFYFTGDADRVRCFSCRQTVENWQAGDVPAERHLQASPACKYLSCTHRLGPAGLLNGAPYDEEAEDMEYRLCTGEVVDESTYPLAPHMRSEDARLRSFGPQWPLATPVQPRALAQAGLYYLGEGDRVQCFCCGGKLAGWEPGDEAWKEHERHFPHCFFILGHDVGNEPSSPTSDQGASVMESFEERLRSFNGVQHPVDPERLARAGFYSTGRPPTFLFYSLFVVVTGRACFDWVFCQMQLNSQGYVLHPKLERAPDSELNLVMTGTKQNGFLVSPC